MRFQTTIGMHLLIASSLLFADVGAIAPPTVSTSLPQVACETREDCSGHGECTAFSCVCDYGFATAKNGALCAYEQKSQLTAFLLTLVFGLFGAGDFYMEQNFLGGFQLASTAGGLMGVVVMSRFGNPDKRFRKLKDGMSIGGSLCAASSVLSWLTTTTAVATGAVPDANGVKLASWWPDMPPAEKKQIPNPPQPEQGSHVNIPIGASYVYGDRNAKISVVAFIDYQCPFCAAAEPILFDAVHDLELKGKINVVYKLFPLSYHQDAKPAAKAALAAGEQNGFWVMSKKLFENQDALSSENYKKWAKEIGMDVTKFENDLVRKDSQYGEIIQTDIDLGYEIHIRGTPTIYVGGWELSDISVAGIKNLIKKKNLF